MNKKHLAMVCGALVLLVGIFALTLSNQSKTRSEQKPVSDSSPPNLTSPVSANVSQIKSDTVAVPVSAAMASAPLTAGGERKDEESGSREFVPGSKSFVKALGLSEPIVASREEEITAAGNTRIKRRF